MITAKDGGPEVARPRRPGSSSSTTSRGAFEERAVGRPKSSRGALLSWAGRRRAAPATGTKEPFRVGTSCRPVLVPRAFALGDRRRRAGGAQPVSQVPSFGLPPLTPSPRRRRALSRRRVAPRCRAPPVAPPSSRRLSRRRSSAAARCVARAAAAGAPARVAAARAAVSSGERARDPHAGGHPLSGLGPRARWRRGHDQEVPTPLRAASARSRPVPRRSRSPRFLERSPPSPRRSPRSGIRSPKCSARTISPRATGRRTRALDTALEDERPADRAASRRERAPSRVRGLGPIAGRRIPDGAGQVNV